MDHDTLRIDVDGKNHFQIPLHHLGSIVCFGNVLLSPNLIGRCAEDGRTLVLLDNNGQFRGRIIGPTTGNVLLRRAQNLAFSNTERTTSIARYIVAGKIKNCRTVVLRAARETSDPHREEMLRKTAQDLNSATSNLLDMTTIEEIRGIEGGAARSYFSSINYMIKQNYQTFRMVGRTRRPPRDPINALLSFLYTLLVNDCIGALEGVGLDPQIGFLHKLRPGRPSLALDLMEEFRSVIADRLAIALINRCQLTPKNFVERPGGAVYLNDEGRKEVLIAYQKRKQEEICHPSLTTNIPYGLIPHVQARFISRYLRNDLDVYVPFIYR